MKLEILTLFPALFASPFGDSILGKAAKKELFQIKIHNLRDWAEAPHRVMDDMPYGGGGGMVMKPEPIARALHDLKQQSPASRTLLLSPQGKFFCQRDAQKLAREKGLIFLCGRYEGFDERIRGMVDDEYSIGDYVLTGGEFAAMVMIDAVSRLLPGVLGNSRSAEQDSFSDGLLEYPQYTRPAEFEGLTVPSVLLSGHHGEIRLWRRQEQLKRTLERRPDLLESALLTSEDRAFLTKLGAGKPKPAALALVHYPVLDKRGEVVTTALTNLDLHDLARTAMTFGLQKLYVVTPVGEQQRLAEKIREHWCRGYGAEYNPLRKEALSLVEITSSLDEALELWQELCGEEVHPVLTGASVRDGVSFRSCRKLATEHHLMLIFGTGWGLAPELFTRGRQALEPIEGMGTYNHLPVRSAAAIVMERLYGRKGK